MRAVTYSRVSTARQAESGLSLDDQASLTATAVERRGWSLVARYVDAGRSGTSMARRPELAAALATLAAGDADALVVAKLDRLARSTIDFARIMATAKAQGWALVVLDLDVDTSTPAGELLAGIVATVAQYESRLIAQRVTMAHAQQRQRGNRSGDRPRLDPATRAAIAARHADGEPLAAIARDLNSAGTPTARGGRWYASTVQHVVRSVALDDELAARRARRAAELAAVAS